MCIYADAFGPWKTPPPLPRPDTIKVTIEKYDQDCWEQCGRKDGPCTYCGAHAMCCRHNERRGECDGRGPGFRHGCVAAIGYKHEHRPHKHHRHHKHIPINLVKHEWDCWDQCGKKSGPCAWCGQNAMCCRHREWTGGCDGRGPGFRHGCVPAIGYTHKHTPHSHTINLAKNEHDCWDQCGKKDGTCAWCGANAMCCRHNERRGGCDGRGCGFKHCCVPALTFKHGHSPHRHHKHHKHVPINLVKNENDCWDQCGKKDGTCAWCGANAQ